jgi:hypothetical protein
MINSQKGAQKLFTRANRAIRRQNKFNLCHRIPTIDKLCPCFPRFVRRRLMALTPIQWKWK